MGPLPRRFRGESKGGAGHIVSGFELLLVLFAVLAALYATGALPRARLRSIYRRVRLLGLLWALVIVLFAAGRLFNFP